MVVPKPLFIHYGLSGGSCCSCIFETAGSNYLVVGTVSGTCKLYSTSTHLELLKIYGQYYNLYWNFRSGFLCLSFFFYRKWTVALFSVIILVHYFEVSFVTSDIVETLKSRFNRTFILTLQLKCSKYDVNLGVDILPSEKF